MTYQNDPNPDRPSYPITEEKSYTGWAVGAVVALAVVLGIFAMTTPTDQAKTVANDPTRSTATAPATTGSAVPVPAPGSGQGTAGAPRQTVPPAPAR